MPRWLEMFLIMYGPVNVLILGVLAVWFSLKASVYAYCLDQKKKWQNLWLALTIMLAVMIYYRWVLTL